jgi:hypothetical protein
MKVINIHKRKLPVSKQKVSTLLNTLASDNDLIWPHENWPAMRFKQGFKLGSKGGHGLIRYQIIELRHGESIKFQFLKPDGFYGFHELKINEIDSKSTEIVHEIRMTTTLKESLFWIFIIRWLHDALIVEAFDKVENYVLNENKKSEYSVWVKLLRLAYKRKSVHIIHA